MWKVIAGLTLGYLLTRNNNKTKKEKAMANCNKLFLDFESNLTISKTKRDKLKNSKEILRERIRKHFKENHPDYKPEFYIQGSYKMKTMILTKDNECDLDDGVYFRREPDVTATTLQTWVKKALDGATSEPVKHKSKCLRVDYKGDYHIDFPVYVFPKDSEHPKLAIKNEDFEDSDPKEMVEWYQEQKKKTEQLNRISKYLKAWCDHKRNKMPSGLAMSILASNHLVENERDDISLKETLIAIQDELTSFRGFKCIVPATPNDDLFSDYDNDRKKRFLDNLESLVNDATDAVENEPNQLKASRLWRKHLGDKFPEGENVDMDAKEAQLKALSENILGGTAYTQSNGKITKETTGVKHKPHLFYGG